jgi:O-acetyl-ADP-ribose deacetylase (regulator of RNase III)
VTVYSGRQRSNTEEASRRSSEAIEHTLQGMRELAEQEGINSITMPGIGAGYGGLSWNKVRAVIEEALPKNPKKTKKQANRRLT